MPLTTYGMHWRILCVLSAEIEPALVNTGSSGIPDLNDQVSSGAVGQEFSRDIAKRIGRCRSNI